MTDDHHDPLATRLLHDAQTALPEPSAKLAANIRSALAAAREATAPGAATAAVDVPNSPQRLRPRLGPLSLMLSSAAVLLIAVTRLGGDRPLAPPVSQDEQPGLSLAPQHTPLEPLLARDAAVDQQPLLVEWQHLTRDARGTADELVAKVQRPLQDLASLSHAITLSAGALSSILSAAVTQRPRDG